MLTGDEIDELVRGRNNDELDDAAFNAELRRLGLVRPTPELVAKALGAADDAGMEAVDDSTKRKLSMAEKKMAYHKAQLDAAMAVLKGEDAS